MVQVRDASPLMLSIATNQTLQRSHVLRAYNFTLQKPPALEREGMSVFVMDENGDTFHTYSAYARGMDIFNTAYNSSTWSHVDGRRTASSRNGGYGATTTTPADRAELSFFL